MDTTNILVFAMYGGTTVKKFTNELEDSDRNYDVNWSEFWSLFQATTRRRNQIEEDQLDILGIESDVMADLLS